MARSTAKHVQVVSATHRKDTHRITNQVAIRAFITWPRLLTLRRAQPAVAVPPGGVSRTWGAGCAPSLRGPTHRLELREHDAEEAEDADEPDARAAHHTARQTTTKLLTVR